MMLYKIEINKKKDVTGFVKCIKIETKKRILNRPTHKIISKSQVFIKD